MLFFVKGIVLKSIPCAEVDCVITLITARELVNVFVKGGLNYQSPHRGNLDSLTFGSYTFQRHKNNMGQLLESNFFNSHLFLRNDFEKLSAADKMRQAILDTQWPEKPIPGIYSLLHNCLHKLETFPDPNFLLAFFRLKIMQHDGILDCSDACSICGQPIDDSVFRHKGQILCSEHKHALSVVFSKHEEIFLKTLVTCKSFEKLSELCKCGFTLFEKISFLFNTVLE
ncbi:MAG: DNA repair protein RecO [Victivallaceae bacterium]